MPDRSTVEKFPVYDGLLNGAKNTVEQCLSVKAKDVVTLICDRTSLDAAAALTKAIQLTGAEFSVYILENHSARPADKIPEVIADAIKKSTVTIYGVKIHPGEYAHRKELLSLVESLGIRHAHILGMNANTLQIGMAADYKKIAKLNELIIKKMKAARHVYVRSFSGTELKLTIDHDIGIESSSGIITPKKWENLPSGEVAFVPKSIDGTFVCDGHLPLDFEVKRTELQRKAVRLNFLKDHLIHIEGGPDGEGAAINKVIEKGQNLKKVSAVTIGTNFAIKAWSGNPVFDGYAPGAHLSLGENSGLLKLPWQADQQLAFHCRRTGVVVDEEPIITYGKFEEDILKQLS